MKWFRTDANNVVTEVANPHPSGQPIAECFHPAVAATWRTTNNDAVTVGSVHNPANGNFTAAPAPPPPPPEEIARRAQGWLSSSDRAIMAFYEMGQPVSAPWLAYRSALRAIIANPTSNATFPTEPAMPV